MLIYQALYFG